MTHLHHVVLFMLHEGADVGEAIRVIDESRPASGVISWSVARSIDTRKGTVIAEVAVFESFNAFEHFRDSPAHRAAGQYMASVSDWVIADWLN